MLLKEADAENTSFIIIRPIVYRTQGEHANQYTIWTTTTIIGCV